MRRFPYVRGREAVGLMVLLAAVPCAAQTSTPATTPTTRVANTSPAQGAAPARLSSEEAADFARLSLLVGQTRDSVQKLLAMPRNKTPQAQQAIREGLATQLGEVLHHAGMTETEFRRRTFVVSTDSAARAVYDATIAKLTGAPLPGQVAAAPGNVKVPDGPVGVHLAHLVNAFPDAPRMQGLLPTALAEARIASLHASLGARDPNNLENMKTHAGHVIHAVDPTVVTTGPGLGYGVKRAALGVATHIDLAAKTAGASPNVLAHGAHVGASARTTIARSDEIVALAKRIQAATTAADAASLMSQLVSLTNELVLGKDANADGKVGLEPGEGGLQQCDEHMKLLLTAEVPH